jgi:hypothetical protein
MTSKFLFAIFLCVGSAFCLTAQSPYTEKGDKQYDINNFEGAIQSYTKALKALPNNDLIQSKLGDANRKMGKMNEALAWYEKAAVKGDAATIIQLGKAYTAKGQYAKAKETFAKIAAKNSDAAHFVEASDFAIAPAPASNYKVTNVAELNSQFDDFMPSFLNNGSFVYLSTRNDMQRKGSKTPVGANQLLTTTFTNNVFSKPAFFNTDLKNNYNEGPVSESSTMAILTQNNFLSGVRPTETKSLELSMRKAIIDKTGHWQTTQSLNVGGQGYSNGYAAISEDGQQLVFSSDRPGGQGGFDLYTCKRSGEEWGVPIPLGEINTPGNEITPFLIGNNLFFSSDYHIGLGGYDVFRAESSDGLYKDLYHLGNQVNSSTDDYGFILDDVNGYGMLTSNRDGGKGGEDLYLVSKLSKNVTIICKNEDGAAVPNAKVDLTKCDDVVGTSDINGKYAFQFIGDIDCSAIISKEGYLPTSKKIDADGAKQAIEVILKKAPESYFGYVFDEQEEPIEGVLVRATNMENQKKVEVFSDATGKFSLPIEAKKDYLLLLSKEKYINLNVNRNDVDAKNMALGAVRMKLATNDYSNDTRIKNPGGIVSTVDKFTVQLAAVRGKNTDLKPYQTALKDVGEVFMTESGNDVYKIKVGKFKTREDAVAALKKVEAAGYKGMITTGIKGGAETAPMTPPIPAIQYSNYHVRLTTLSKPENFEMTKVEKIAKVTSMKNGALTIFLLSNFKTLDDAKHALEMAKTAGFKDAYLVEKTGDKLTKVE